MDVKLTFLKEIKHAHFSSVSNGNVLSVVTQFNTSITVVDYAISDDFNQCVVNANALQVLEVSYLISFTCSKELVHLHIIASESSCFASANGVHCA